LFPIKYTLVYALFFSLFGTIYGQEKSDSLAQESPRRTSIPVKCIKGWQSISYKLDFLNCQFKHNCSQFAIDSISSCGFFAGSLITTNRLIRCNPLARFCYNAKNNYLIDDSGLAYNKIHLSFQNSKIYTLSLYSLAVIPGVHKALSGKWSDAVFTIGLITFGMIKSIDRFNSDQYIHGGITLSLTLLLYASDIYWSAGKIRQRSNFD
jgi:putative component of membrane protein insertase Oxa1/YidC/SpoIIIJ protein YidD